MLGALSMELCVWRPETTCTQHCTAHQHTMSQRWTHLTGDQEAMEKHQQNQRQSHPQESTVVQSSLY